MTKWIFLGDDSRKIFIGKILKISPEEIPDEKSLIIRRGENILSQENIGENILLYKSYYLPPETEIFLPTYSTNINISEENFDNCAIFEMFPFGKESTENFVKLFDNEEKNYPEILFVMMDIVEGEENSFIGLNTVREIFLKKNRDIIIFRDESDILKILHWHKPLGSDIVNSIRRELQEIYIRVDEIDDYYENFLTQEKSFGCLSSATKNKIISFDTVKNQSLIWICYKNAAQKILFSDKNGGIKNLLALYRKIFFQGENSLAALIWNVSAECSRLEEKLQKKFEEITQTPKKFQSFLNPEENYSAHIYRALIRQGGRFGGIDESFLAVYEKFLKNYARKIFTAELNSHIKDLKKILDERRNKTF